MSLLLRAPLRRSHLLVLRAVLAGALAFAAGPLARGQPAAGPLPAADRWSHAYSAYGQPRYPRGFAHFDYVNPQAPKGGTLQLNNPDRRTSFDKYNPYTIKGQSPAGLTTLMFETLAQRSGDEPDTMYGMVAEDIQVAPDKAWVAFRIHPRARFINGDPVTAADVAHVFEMLTSKEVSPATRTQLEGVARATVLDPRTIRFDLKERTADTIFNVGGLPVFSPKWSLDADGKPKKFSDVVNEFPITTGPYKVGTVEAPRRIEFVRDPDYWARDLGVAKGQYNFDRIVYRYYQDNAISIEAFKAGEFDFLMEYSARRWARQHSGPKWDDGRIVKEEFPTGFGMGLQAYYFNLRKPLFQDRRVREALGLAYDFASINVYRQYKRVNSLFANSEFAARGEPSAGELALLERFRSELPPAVFGPPWEDPRTDLDPNGLRNNLKRARKLLEEAGWKVDADGALRNAKGERFEFEWLEAGEAFGRREAVYQRNLALLGIKLNVRLVDFALYRKRLETFDFDMINLKSGDWALPNAADLKAALGSAAADEQASANYAGIKNKAIDFLVDRMDKATTMDELRTATRALDRVFMREHYVVPDLYGASNRVSRWDKFGIPKVVPKYYTIATPSDYLQWAVTTWWDKALDNPAAPAQAKSAKP
ncbi:MAG: ABC transporter substrate-binding protein [Betaproteobacteria bacterium]|nr:ABC transporter substrate-binding protein [Betaproteobacteria bacterium]